MTDVRRSTFLVLAALTLPWLHALANPNPPIGGATQFQVSEKTQVPGHVLKPGSYTLTMVDHLSDRMVLRINNDSGKEEATFLAVNPSATFPSNAEPGPVDMRTKGGHVAALRGFVFPDGTRAEFAYLKAEAVPLAKANNTTIIAIDPSSEGRPDKDNLSPNDRQLVTLWMVTPTFVGKTPAMEAQRYQLAANANPEPPRDWSLPPARSARAPQTTVATNTPPPPPHRVANPIPTLPHTASSQPLVWLAGLISLFAATLLSFRRFTAAGVR